MRFDGFWNQLRKLLAMKILIIEDETRTGSYLKKGLEEEGFGVDLIPDGNAGFQAALSSEYGLLLLDVNLPGRDGWSILEALRQKKSALPILMLTARDGVRDRVRGLTHGADDYLIKPFAFSELVARIRSVLRRGPQRRPDSFKLADLELDPTRHTAKRGRQTLELTAKEFSLLWLLASRQGEVLGRTLISELVWDINFDGDSNVVDVAIRRLRSKVDDPFEIKLIHTVRGIGYVLRVENS